MLCCSRFLLVQFYGFWAETPARRPHLESLLNRCSCGWHSCSGSDLSHQSLKKFSARCLPQCWSCRALERGTALVECQSLLSPLFVEWGETLFGAWSFESLPCLSTTSSRVASVDQNLFGCSRAYSCTSSYSKCPSRSLSYSLRLLTTSLGYFLAWLACDENVSP